MIQYKGVNIIPECYVTSLVKLFKLNETEGYFDPSSNNNRNSINLSSYILSD